MPPKPVAGRECRQCRSTTLAHCLCVLRPLRVRLRGLGSSLRAPGRMSQTCLRGRRPPGAERRGCRSGPSAARQRRVRGAVDGPRSKGAGRGSQAVAVTWERFARGARAVPPLSPARPRCVRNRWVARSRARRRGEEGIRLPTRGDLRDWEARDHGESSIVRHMARLSSDMNGRPQNPLNNRHAFPKVSASACAGSVGRGRQVRVSTLVREASRVAHSGFLSRADGSGRPEPRISGPGQC